MKKTLCGLFLATTILNAQALTERDASKVVKKYSEAVACQLEGPNEFQKHQYKAVMVDSGDKELGGYGATFVVFWEGDFGCMGGSGTIVPNFTVVSQMSGQSLIVDKDYVFPSLQLVHLTSFTGKNGLLFIKGVTYGPNDQQGRPSKAVSYTLKYVDGKFLKQ